MNMLKTTLAAATALAIGALPATAALAQQKVKLGFVTTLSGGAAAIGNDMRDGVELALDHLGRKFGPLPVEVIYEDDEQKPDVGKQKTDKLVQRDRVDFVSGYIWSNVLLASYKSVVDANIFLISANAGPSQLAGAQCNQNFFAASWMNDQIPVGMGHLLNQKGINKLYVIAPNYAAGQDMAAGVLRNFKGQVVGQDMTKWPDQLDFSAELSKVRAANPDAVFTFFPGRHGVQILTQFAQAGLKDKIPLYSAYTIDATTIPLQKDLAIGSIITMHWGTDLPYPANQKMVADFRKKYKRTLSFYGAQAYEAMLMLNNAVTAVKGDLKNKNGIRDALRKANFDSTRGPLKFGNNHFPIHNIYQQEVVKSTEAPEGIDFRTVSTVLTAFQDEHASKCPMKW